MQKNLYYLCRVKNLFLKGGEHYGHEETCKESREESRPKESRSKKESCRKKARKESCKEKVRSMQFKNPSAMLEGIFDF